MIVEVYTAIYGGYDKPKPVPTDDAHYTLFTDDPDLDASGWTVIVDPLRDVKSPMLRAKYWKTHPHVAFPNVDATVWIDGSLEPGDRFSNKCVEALGWHELALTPHPLRDCIYTELEASLPLPKYDPVRMQAQCDHYRRWGHPEHWGLFASGCMIRTSGEDVAEFNERWWRHNQYWSWQDQLSLSYVLRLAQLDWVATLPWGMWWNHVEHGF